MPESTETDRDVAANPPSMPVRPLRPWISRVFITVAIISALALASAAAWMMGSLGSDGTSQSRYDTINRMRAAEDSAAAAGVYPDSTAGTKSR